MKHLIEHLPMLLQKSGNGQRFIKINVRSET